MDVELAFDAINKKIEKIAEVTTKVTDNEYVKLAGEASKLVNVAVKFNNFIIKRRFEACLRGFSGEKPTDEQLIKLEKYIDTPEKAEFIADSFRKVLLSNSSEASLIMGSIINSVITEEDSITHEKLISLNSLSQFYDIDIRNFLLLYEYVDYDRLKIKIRTQGVPIPKTKFNLAKLSKFANEKGVSKESLIITLDKSINLQLVNRLFESEIDVQYDADMDMTDVSNKEISEYYFFNDMGEYTKSLIDRVR